MGKQRGSSANGNAHAETGEEAAGYRELTRRVKRRPRDWSMAGVKKVATLIGLQRLLLRPTATFVH